MWTHKIQFTEEKTRMDLRFNVLLALVDPKLIADLGEDVFDFPCPTIQSNINSLKLFTLQPFAKGLQMVLVLIAKLMSSVKVFTYGGTPTLMKQPIRVCHKH